MRADLTNILEQPGAQKAMEEASVGGSQKDTTLLEPYKGREGQKACLLPYRGQWEGPSPSLAAVLLASTLPSFHWVKWKKEGMLAELKKRFY